MEMWQSGESVVGVKEILNAKREVGGSMTVTLKKQVKELQEKLEEREEEMGKVRRNVKLTRIQEIETELKVY